MEWNGRGQRPGVGRGDGGGAIDTGSPGKRTLVQARTNRTGGPLRDARPAASERSAPSTNESELVMGLDVQMQGGGGDPAMVQEAAAAGVADGGGPLPHLDRIQHSFGAHDVSGVRAHTGGAAAEASQAMGAEAYATGNDVAFDGAPTLHTAAHEAAHVVQQRGDVQLKGGVGEVGDRYEAHADRVADAVVAGASAGPILDEMAGAPTSTPSRAIQRFDRHHATGPAGHGPNTAAGGGATRHAAQTVTYASITAGTIKDFTDLAEAQADWSMQITVATQQAELRSLATWLRGPDRATSLATFAMTDLVANKTELAALDAYARARGTTTTVPIAVAANLVEARDFGRDIVKLEAVASPGILHHIFDARSFALLRATTGALDAFCHYVSTCHPLLQAPEGTEIDSFLLSFTQMRDLTVFRSLSDVRNYHRFDVAALITLSVNQAGNFANKPLCLILHSAFDWNGAFHHDPQLTLAIQSSSNHTIMIEGAESLDAIASRLPSIVATHGRLEPDPADATKHVRRIDQVMIAGHGSAHSIELAGTLQSDAGGAPKVDAGDGSPLTNDDSIDLSVDPKDPATVTHAARSRALMAQIMSLMSQDPTTPHGRIVFNACLTASNEIDPHAIDGAATPDQQAQQMRDAITASPSLVTAMRQIATDQGRNVDVRGGNGSFGQVGLVDAAGGLDIVADGTGNRTLDPELTNPDKLVYVERGTDPDGCMSAVAERWAQDRATLMPAVQRRRATPLGTGWQETVIQAMYELVETRYAQNGSAISLLASVTSGFDELSSSSMARVWSIWNVRANEDWRILHDRLSVIGEWAQPFVPVIFYQGWLFRDATKIRDFLAAVGAMTVADSHDFLDMPALRPMWNQLVPATAGRVPDPGQLRLALRDFNDNAHGAQAHTRSFLTSLVHHGAFTVDVAGPLGGLDDANGVLRGLGLLPTQAGGHQAGPPPDGNLDMNHDGTNESVVEAMSATGTVNTQELYVREQASLHGRPHAQTLHQGDVVHIMGQTPLWYLVDHDGVRGYAYKSYVDLVP
jgi:hypothetical protein